MSTRVGDWIQTYQGGQMYPLDPDPAEIDIQDIAHALSNLCRFNGHVKTFYSVAEHCCHVSDLFVSPAMRLEGLLHDASEAYLCDMPRPMKRSEGFADVYLTAESKLMHTIAVRFGVTWPTPTFIMMADNRVLGTEALQLMSPLHPEWRDRYEPVSRLVLPCWEPTRAREEFLKRYFEIVAG